MKYSIDDVKRIVANKLKVKSVQFLGAGNHSEAFCINNNLVIKMPKHKKASDCLQVEMKVIKGLENKLNLDIPNVEYAGKFKNENEEFVYSIFKKLEGKKLSRKEFLKLNKSVKEKCATSIAQFLFKLHNQKEILPIKRKDFALLHGDFSLGHILFDENNLPCGVLDFGDARVGKPISDFVYLLDDEDDEEFGKEFGLQVLEKYNKLAKQKTDIINQKVQ